MKRIPPIPLLLLVVGGCVGSRTGSDSEGERLPWQAGRYELSGSVRYRQDTEMIESSATLRYEAELEIGADGSMRMLSSSGLCLDRTPDQVARDQARWQRTFECNEVTYLLKPAPETIRGEMRVIVTESIRSRGPCIQYGTVDNQQVCIAYEWTLRPRAASKRATLRVFEVGDRP